MRFYYFFFLGLNFTFAGGIEDETKDYEDVELTTREDISEFQELQEPLYDCLLYTSPSPRDVEESRMPSSA